MLQIDDSLWPYLGSRDDRIDRQLLVGDRIKTSLLGSN
jgi:hypothetical protein